MPGPRRDDGSASPPDNDGDGVTVETLASDPADGAGDLATTETDAGPSRQVTERLDPVEATPEERAAKLETEKKELWDRFLRTAADYDNFRKRARRDVQEATERGRDEVLREILPVADNLERALTHSSENTTDGAALLEGVRMVQKQLLSALERFDIRPLEAIGQKFDPEFHEALSQEDSDADPGTVVREFRRGYRQGSRVIRPAMVVVARARTSTTPSPAADDANHEGSERHG